MYDMVDADRAANKPKAINVKSEVSDNSAHLPIPEEKFNEIAGRFAKFGKKQTKVPSTEEEEEDILHAKRLAVEPKNLNVLERFNRAKFTKNMAGKHRDDLGLLDDAMKNIRYHRMKEQEAATQAMPGPAATMPSVEFRKHSRDLLQREQILETLFAKLKQKKEVVVQEEENLEDIEASMYENENR